MERKSIFNLIILVGLLISTSLFISPECAFAAFSLSITPYEGGYDLRYGRIGLGLERVSKEVSVQIAADIGKQYRLVQMLLEPLTNPQGISIPQNNFLMYGIRNASGAMNVEQEIYVSLGRTIIYTSNQLGGPDSFVLVYSLKGPFNVPPGEYRGRISFTLEPIDSSQAPVTQILNIFAVIETESAIEIKTETGARVISLSAATLETQTKSVLVDCKGDLGSQFRIFQLLLQPLQSDEGKELPAEAINFKIDGAKKGVGQTEATPLSANQKELIYTSGLKGDSESFAINYSLIEPERYNAGRYKTKIAYIVERNGIQDTQDFFDLEAEIAPVFDLIITPELGGVIKFRNIKPSRQPTVSSSEVIIEIKTNIGKKFQVSQKALSDLVNKEGKIVPSDYFTLRTEPIDNTGTDKDIDKIKGLLRFPKNTAVTKEDTAIFISDEIGSPGRFKVIYELNVPLDVGPGDYSANVVYSISEL
ncbi:MAG: hypothetical protein NTW64_01125 [Candidatus Omnitrophica bacterium]|nr:hypothetical protein [Candidatus Omnitrophota bacterium]